MTDPDRMFASDNAAGASAAIVDAVVGVAAEPYLAYGDDPVTDAACRRVSEVFECPTDTHLVSTGTAANAIALSALSPPWGAVVCHGSSHVQVDECGAPEFFTGGAKLIPVSGADGKIDPDRLREVIRARADDVHAVPARALSITQATETGSVYTLDEIGELAATAHAAGLRVHMDGARFANAVTALQVSAAEMSWRCGVDILSFGVTKNGGMTCDAVVSFDPDLATELAYRVKRAGQLASKLRFEAAQVLAYLTDDLWLRNARHANAMAARLVTGLVAGGVPVHGSPRANVVFCELPAPTIVSLIDAGFVFHHGIGGPGRTRLVTSHVTTRGAVDALVDHILSA